MIESTNRPKRTKCFGSNRIFRGRLSDQVQFSFKAQRFDRMGSSGSTAQIASYPISTAAVVRSSHSMNRTISRRNFLAGTALLAVSKISIAQQAPASAGALDRALIEDLVAAYRILA